MKTPEGTGELHYPECNSPNHETPQYLLQLGCSHLRWFADPAEPTRMVRSVHDNHLGDKDRDTERQRQRTRRRQSPYLRRGHTGKGDIFFLSQAGNPLLVFMSAYLYC